MILNDQTKSGPGALVGVDRAGVRLFEAEFTSKDFEFTRPGLTRCSSEYAASLPRIAWERGLLVQEPITVKPRNDEFLAQFSHEVRSALGAIQNAAHLLRMQRDETAIGLKVRILIERQVGRMSRLVDDLLDKSRVSNGLSLQRERVDLRVVVRHAIETLELDMSSRSHHLSVTMPDAPVWLRADAGRLEQVLVNLLGNAAKYTDPCGTVALVVQRIGLQAVVSVRDSGIGIAPDILPHVFDLYMQADPASRRAEGGLGIGLALVRSLVELHGGEVTASSSGLGQGSEFCIRLPIEPERCP